MCLVCCSKHDGGRDICYHTANSNCYFTGTNALPTSHIQCVMVLTTKICHLSHRRSLHFTLLLRLPIYQSIPKANSGKPMQGPGNTTLTSLACTTELTCITYPETLCGTYATSNSACADAKVACLCNSGISPGAYTQDWVYLHMQASCL